MNNETKDGCVIKAETKLRNGYPNWWCFTHNASARGQNGVKLEKCHKADLPPIAENEKIYINLQDYPGGVGIWGSLEAVYDTKREVSESGVHVHLRVNEYGSKEVDATFKEVYIKRPSTLFDENNWVKIDEHTACAYTASNVFNKKLKILRCKHCNREHVDAEYFAVHYHRKHFCTFCGREFIDTEHGISNPVYSLQETFREILKQRTITKVDRKLIVDQKDYKGGIQIWGSNPAIIWSAKRPEESGIHVHLFSKESKIPVIDETFGYVEIDGIELDDLMIRSYMVQKSLNYLNKYIVSLKCPICAKDHFDQNDNGLNPHKVHNCEHCGAVFEDNTRYKGVVSNPIVSRLKTLEDNYTKWK